MHRSIVVAALALTLSACPEATEPATTPDCTCADDQLCYYTADIEGIVETEGCVDYPVACVGDRSCDCVNDDESEPVCSELGFEQNFDACRVIGDQPVLYCEANLG